MKDYTKPELVEMESIPVEGVYAGSGDVEEEKPVAPAVTCPRGNSFCNAFDCAWCNNYNWIVGSRNTCSLGIPSNGIL